jgi:hypothetical protein
MPAPAKTVQEHQSAPVEKQNIQDLAVEKSPDQAPYHLATSAFIQADAGAGAPQPHLRHLPASQRHNLARRIGQVHANGLLQLLLRPQAGVGDTVIRRVPVNIGGMTANTGAEAAGLINWAVVLLKQDISPDIPTSDPSYVAASLSIEEAKVYIGNLSGQPDQEVDAATADQISRWYADCVNASTGLNTYQKVRASEDIQKGVASAAATEAKVEAAREQFDFPMEQAFRQNDTERLTKLNNGIAALATAKSSLATLAQTLKEVYSMLIAPGIKAKDLIVGVNPIKPVIQNVLAAFKAANAAISIISGGEGTTQSEQEINNVATALNATGAVATLLGVASGYMVCIGAIVPVGAALLGVVSSILGREGRQLNQQALNAMDLDHVNWEYVPGGRSCFEFMVAVMRSGGPEGVPLPLNSQVNSYFVAERKRMEAGTGSEVPTTGYWFWRDVDDKKIQSWVFQNRRNIWSMLYGELRPNGVPV